MVPDAAYRLTDGSRQKQFVVGVTGVFDDPVGFLPTHFLVEMSKCCTSFG